MGNWRQHHSRMRGGIIAALDVGSSKVCCAIAQVQGEGFFEILGIGHQLSSGVKSGVVIDMEEAITSIVNAVHTAEKMAGLTIRDVFVSVNGTHLKSMNFAMEVNVSGHPVDDGDIRRALLQAKVARELQPIKFFTPFLRDMLLMEQRELKIREACMEIVFGFFFTRF